MNTINLSVVIFILLLQIGIKAFAQDVKVVTILADDAYPPYSYVEDGKLKGIYIEFIRLAAKSLKPYYEINIQAIPWKRGLSEVRQGHAFAIVPPYKHIESRPYIWPYSIALYSETVVTFCHYDINISELISREGSDINVVNVGVNAGYQILNQELKTAKRDGKLNLWENKDTGSNILKLLHRRIDCYLNDRLSTIWEFRRLKKQFPEKSYSFKNIYEAMLVMTQTSHIGYSDVNNEKYRYKDDFVRRMDEALIKLYNTKEYVQIISQYDAP